MVQSTGQRSESVASPRFFSQGSSSRGRGRASGRQTGSGQRGSEASAAGAPVQARVFSLTQQEARDDRSQSIT